MKNIILLLMLSSSLYSQKTTINKILIPYREKNLWGFSDTLGNIKVKPIYKDVKSFFIDEETNFTARYVVKTNKKYFVIDQNSKVLLPELNNYDSIYINKLYYDRFSIYRNGKTGIFLKNKELIPCIYDKLSIATNESYYVKNGKLEGLINSSGKIIIPLKYKNVHPSWEDNDKNNSEYVWVAEGEFHEKKFYDKKINPEKYDGEIYEKTLAQEPGSKDYESYLEKKRIELKKIYDEVDIDAYNSVAYVTKNNKKGLVMLYKMEEIIRPIYDELVNYGWDKSESVYKVKLNNKYGLVKPRNVIVLNCEFDEIEADRVLVKDGKKGFIVFNTIYPYIKPKYLTIKSIEGVQVNENWQFGLFEVTTPNGKGFVGENGVEFFKD
ncbi:WG repeat-containing protein [Flavobacterium sp.]|uniref:WG repeat-containing protein n=1 Tax=Flavobacterium sp. TaxID=239 RepID=UPI0037516E4F